MASNCLAADRSWTNTLGGTFSTVSNWHSGLFAGVNDVACFNNSSVFFPPGQTNYTINFSSAAQNQAIKVRNDFVTFNLSGRTYTTTQITGNEIGTIGGAGTILTARSARLTIQNGTFNFNAPLTSQMLVGAVPGGLGSLVISTGGVLTGSPNLLVGTPSASGTFIVNGGTATLATLSLGSGASGHGTAVINGPFAGLTSNTLLVGNAGAGTMSMLIGAIVQNNGGATVGNVANSSGVVNVDGGTVRWTQTGSLQIGNAGAGTVNVLNGGSLNGAGAGILGNTATGFGRLNVVGSNSRARFTELTIGNAGVGSVTIAGSGSVSNNGTTLIGNNGAGFVDISSGGRWFSSGTTVLANATLSTARVDVRGATSSWSCGTLHVASDGAASLNISDGGVVTCSELSVSRRFGSGAVTVDGPGSRLVSFSSLLVGINRAGTLSISNGGVVENDDAFIGSSGVVSLAGEGSQWNNAARLFVSGFGSGATLAVSDGGRVQSEAAFIGSGGTGTEHGTAIVRDPGSQFTVGTLSLGGGNAVGTLEITNGGFVHSETARIVGHTDFGPNLESRATVSGAGSTWENNGSLTVGGSGTLAVSGFARLDVESGATVQNADAFIAISQTSHGTVTVGGTDANWTTQGDLYVGGSTLSAGGSGTLIVNAGGLATVTDTLTVWNNGVVHLNGGELAVGSITFPGSTFDFDAGTLRFREVVTLNTALLDKTLGSAHIIGPNQHLAFNLAPSLTTFLTLDGGVLSTPSWPVSSSPQFVSGTFNLTSDNLTIGTGGLFGDTLVLDDRNVNVTNSTTIQPGARLFLQGGDFSSGLITNNGEIVLDSANSQISGGLLTNNGIIRGGAVIANPVQNNAVGQIIVEGSVSAQFQNDLINNSEVRIVAGSVAEFSGDVTGSGAFTGAGTKIFKPASIATLGPLDTPGHTVVEAGATLNATRIREQSLNVNGNVRISPAGTNNGTSRLNSLTISGSGQLDLSDNDLIIDYSGASPIGQIAQHVVTGRAGGNWNGSGITSSAAAAQAAHATTLGVLESAEFIALTGASEFSGQPIDTSAVLVKYTWYGDSDFNGIVNFDDYARIDAGFSTNKTGWLNGDFDLSGGVNFDDYALIDLAFNAQSGTLIRAMDWLEGEDRSMRGMDDPALQMVMKHAAQFGSGYGKVFLAAVPEPSVAALVGFAMTSFARRCRRR